MVDCMEVEGLEIEEQGLSILIRSKLLSVKLKESKAVIISIFNHIIVTFSIGSVDVRNVGGTDMPVAYVVRNSSCKF